jgi:hypothetical protein
MSKLLDAITIDIAKLIPMLIDYGKCPGHFVEGMSVLTSRECDCAINEGCLLGDEHCTVCWSKHLEV